MDNATLGRKILLGVNITTALSGLLADFNRTHLFNKRWTPHAKFHDGMTLSLGLLLGGLGAFALLRNRGSRRDNVRLAALCPAAFFASMLSAYAYPGAGGIKTEFPEWPKLAGLPLTEGPFAVAMLLAAAAGWKLAEEEVERVNAALREASATARIEPEPVGV